MNTKRAFTLIELMVVVAIIGLLATILLANVNTARERGRDSKRVADIQQIQNALHLYGANLRPEAYPEGDDSTALNDLVLAGYITVIPKDPSGTEYQYKGTGSCGATCNAYHLGASLELGNTFNKELDGDRDCDSGDGCFGAVDTNIAGDDGAGCMGETTLHCYDISNL